MTRRLGGTEQPRGFADPINSMLPAQLREWISGLPRRRKQTVLVVFDAVVLAAVAWIAFSLRFNRIFEPNGKRDIAWVHW